MKIHQEGPWQLLPEARIHGLHIVLVDPRNADPLLHRFLIPGEVFLPARVPQHDIPADRFQGIPGRIGPADLLQRFVHAVPEGFFVTGKVGKAHGELFGQQAVFSGKQEDLFPEPAESAEQIHILCKNAECLRIEHGIHAAPVKQLLHQEQRLGWRGL